MAPITCDTCARSFDSKIEFFKHITTSPLGCKWLTTTSSSSDDTDVTPSTYPFFIGKRQINNKLEWERYKSTNTGISTNNAQIPLSTLRLNTRRPVTAPISIPDRDNNATEMAVDMYGTHGSKIAYMQKTQYVKPDIRALRTSNSHMSKDAIDDYIKKNTQKIVSTRDIDLPADERPRIRSSTDGGVTYQIGRTKYDTKIAYYNALTSMGKTEVTTVNMSDITKLTQMHGKLRHELTSIQQFGETILINQPTIIGEDYYVLDGITRHCPSTKKMIFKLIENMEGSILVINASQVIIDLNGFEIRQSDSDAITDRFNDVIEFIGCDHCYVTNGIIGSSSRSGLSITDSSDILISNTRFQGYEYAAIRVVGTSHNISLSGLKLLGNKTTVPVNGWYDVMSKLIKGLQEMDTEESNAIVSTFDKMTTQLIQKKVEGQFTRMNLSLFDNRMGMVYTNTYGIMIDTNADANGYNNIYISDVHINAQVNKIDEVITAYKDMHGSAFPLFETMREDLRYEENMISKAQLLLNDTDASGNIDIDPDYISNDSVYTFGKRLKFGIDYLMRPCIGNIGISIKNGRNICVERCNCSNIINKSPMGKVPGNYDLTNRNYLLQLQKEYKGANAYGMMVDGCSTVFLRDITISGVVSSAGAAYGLSVIGNSKDIRVSRLSVDKLRADSKTKLVLYNSNPTTIPSETPRHVEGGSSVVVI